jgi:uncharacterized protein YneF (UPF0154 family)
MKENLEMDERMIHLFLTQVGRYIANKRIDRHLRRMP